MKGVFEKICRDFTMDHPDSSFTKVGRWWHKGKEIDIVALDEKTKEITFFECKWKNLKENEAKKIIKDLKEKAKYVNWFNGKESYGLIAKKIQNKKKLRKEFIAFDVEDFEKWFGRYKKH